jgi:hypothetical protein
MVNPGDGGPEPLTPLSLSDDFGCQQNTDIQSSYSTQLSTDGIQSSQTENRHPIPSLQLQFKKFGRVINFGEFPQKMLGININIKAYFTFMNKANIAGCHFYESTLGCH